MDFGCPGKREMATRITATRSAPTKVVVNAVPSISLALAGSPWPRWIGTSLAIAGRMPMSKYAPYTSARDTAFQVPNSVGPRSLATRAPDTSPSAWPNTALLE